METFFFGGGEGDNCVRSNRHSFRRLVLYIRVDTLTFSLNSLSARFEVSKCEVFRFYGQRVWSTNKSHSTELIQPRMFLFASDREIPWGRIKRERKCFSMHLDGAHFRAMFSLKTQTQISQIIVRRTHQFWPRCNRLKVAAEKRLHSCFCFLCYFRNFFGFLCASRVDHQRSWLLMSAAFRCLGTRDTLRVCECVCVRGVFCVLC